MRFDQKVRAIFVYFKNHALIDLHTYAVDILIDIHISPLKVVSVGYNAIMLRFLQS